MKKTIIITGLTLAFASPTAFSAPISRENSTPECHNFRTETSCGWMSEMDTTQFQLARLEVSDSQTVCDDGSHLLGIKLIGTSTRTGQTTEAIVSTYVLSETSLRAHNLQETPTEDILLALGLQPGQTYLLRGLRFQGTFFVVGWGHGVVIDGVVHPKSGDACAVAPQPFSAGLSCNKRESKKREVLREMISNGFLFSKSLCRVAIEETECQSHSDCGGCECASGVCTECFTPIDEPQGISMGVPVAGD